MQSKGLGDDIKRITSATGLDQLAKRIAQILDEDCGCDHDDEDDHEGSMAKSDLASTAELADEINDMIDSDDELEGWVQAKITKAADYIEAVHKYMKHDY